MIIVRRHDLPHSSRGLAGLLLGDLIRGDANGNIRTLHGANLRSGFGGTDLVGNDKNSRAGLVLLEIKYSDGSRGDPFVSCGLNGTPAAVYEGTTASKGLAEFWDQSVNDTINNGTLFHVLQGEDPKGADVC